MSKTIVEQIAEVDTKIAKLQEQRAELVAEQERGERLRNLATGSRVTVKLGRAETTRTVEGEVLAVAEDRAKVLVGSGMDTDVVVVSLKQVLEVL